MRRVEKGFAIWITGLPASGKSTLARAVEAELDRRGINVAVLESDALRKVFTPRPRYDADERELFYGALVHVGAILADHGVSVVFDATANRRVWRDKARGTIGKFIEVYAECPLEVCVARDPKGIYRRGRTGEAPFVPGLSAEYEPPDRPEVVVRSDREEPRDAAARVVAALVERGYLGK